MNFFINSIILWPKRIQYKYKQIEFESGKINIITGSSRTGKSAIIPIVDYCLGADKCTIPVDTIRNACEWFGVLFNLGGEKILICRREPGTQDSTGDVYYTRGKDLEIPETIKQNNTLQQLKNILNELFSISFHDLEPTATNYFFARPSYRDFMAFLFQPQNLIANADVLFYKADTTEHRQKLINIFPYVLGAVTPQVLAARQEIERLNKEKERLIRDLSSLKEVAENWKQEVLSWLTRSRELGLTTYIPKQEDFANHVDQLRLIIKKTEVDSKIIANNIRDISDELIMLRKEEEKISSELFAAQQRYSEMNLLSTSVGQYDQSLQIQLNRLEISTWIKNMITNDKVCPICGTEHNQALQVVEDLCNAIAEIEKTAGNMRTIPAAFEREMQLVLKDIDLLSEKLSAIRKRIEEESGQFQKDTDKKYTLSSVARFLGQMESAVQTYDKIGSDNGLEEKIGAINERLSALYQIVNEAEIKGKLSNALRYIENEASKIISTLDVERPDDPIEFIINDLTIRIKNNSGRNDYLWEIGSASNWLSYHIAVFLAFQKYFQERGKISIPNIIIFDQPSQVYFPQVLAHKNSKLKEDEKLDDEDKEAVRKIFLALSKYVIDTERKVQILVMEHADEDVWGEIENIHLVKRWRGNNEKLIPAEWIN